MATLEEELAKRDALIAELQTQNARLRSAIKLAIAKRPLALKLAAKEVGVPYGTAWEWTAKGLVKTLDYPPGAGTIVDANELGRGLISVQPYPD